MFQSLLIANRGEIAGRIIRTARSMGLRTIAVYSDADVRSSHVLLADEALHLGAADPNESYLNVEAILLAAARSGADAIHPGYGFLAESAVFARACEQAGRIFVGPPAAVINRLGDKRQARWAAQDAGLPVVPGYDGTDQRDETLLEAAVGLGFPLLVKPAMGGGGTGMQQVVNPAELSRALKAARRQARQAFGDDNLLLERALLSARHIEVQILADGQGRVVHLGERDCSLQRRRQKVIEEAPAPALALSLQQQLATAAVSLARAVGYQNAGTVEFLVVGSDHFYFLEMNTRLQVEHPVTEALTGLDLVEWQLRIAAGEALTLSQEAIAWDGHAIEARIYAESPAQGFLPTSGPVALWRPPDMPGVRVDAGILTGDQVLVHYDPLLAKVIAHGPDRPAALRRLALALGRTVLLGLESNLDFLLELAGRPELHAGAMGTNFIEAAYGTGWVAPVADALAYRLAALLAFRHALGDRPNAHWRNNPNRAVPWRFAGRDGRAAVAWIKPLAGKSASFLVAITAEDHQPPGPGDAGGADTGPARGSGTSGELTDAGSWAAVDLEIVAEGEYVVTVDGYRQRVWAVRTGERWWLHTRSGRTWLKELPQLPLPRPRADAGGSLRAPMPGAVIEVLVQVGDRVEPGQPLMVLAAMKMEHTIRSAADGIVRLVHYQAGDAVEAEAQLVEIDEI